MTRRSQANASSKPSATAYPVTAAIVGLSQSGRRNRRACVLNFMLARVVKIYKSNLKICKLSVIVKYRKNIFNVQQHPLNCYSLSPQFHQCQIQSRKILLHHSKPILWLDYLSQSHLLRQPSP